MQFIKVATIGLLLTYLSGCTSVSAPSSSLIDNTPVITIGSTSNPPKDHIVFIPANTKFSVNFFVNGDVLNKSASTKVLVSFKKSIYLYKYWASLDGKAWVNSHKLLNVAPTGGFDTSGGKVEVRIDFAK